jgi:hypothetical protein
LNAAQLNKNRRRFPVAGFSECVNLARENLLRLVHLHAIARMNVF